MYGAMGKWMAAMAVVTTLVGCGNAKCDDLGKHMAELAIAEAKASGVTVAEDKQAEIAKKTADACNAAPPPDEHLDCALKADSTKAMKLCEGVDEDAKKEEG